MGPHDHGEIAVALRIELLHGDPRIVIDFGPKDIKWFAMTPDEADQFADALKARAVTARDAKRKFDGGDGETGQTREC